MIDRIITFSIRRRGVVILLSVALAVLGWLAIGETPVDAIPDLSEDGVIVFAEWPGHGPQEVEDQITYPLALGLQGVRGVRSVRSSSKFHYSLIHAILDESVTVAEGRRRVLDRLARAGADLPPSVTPRLGPDSPATGQIYWYTVEGKGLDAARLRSLQDWYVKPRLASMLWADGPGAEVIRPTVAPVLGRLLVADEVIDLLLPVLFFQVSKRRWVAHLVASNIRPDGPVTRP